MLLSSSVCFCMTVCLAMLEMTIAVLRQPDANLTIKERCVRRAQLDAVSMPQVVEATVDGTNIVPRVQLSKEQIISVFERSAKNHGGSNLDLSPRSTLSSSSIHRSRILKELAEVTRVGVRQRTVSQRIAEQIIDLPVRWILKIACQGARGTVWKHFVEQIIDVPVPQEPAEVTEGVPQERFKQRTFSKLIIDLPVPRIPKELAEVKSQVCMEELIMVVYVRQIQEESVRHRTGKKIVKVPIPGGRRISTKLCVSYRRSPYRVARRISP